MNNRISKAFNTPNGKAFIAFLTAGDPDMDSTVSFILRPYCGGPGDPGSRLESLGGRHDHRWSL